MKRTLLIVAVTASFACDVARGDDAPPLPLASIRAELQMVSMPPEQARALVPVFQNRQTAPEAWTRVQALIAEDKAKLLGWPIVWLRNGGHSVAQDVMEYRYPTWDIVPGHSGTFIEAATQTLPYPSWSPTTPTAFETRLLGARFDAEATVEKDGQVILLTVSPEFARLSDVRHFHTQRSPDGVEGRMERPEFQSSKITTQLCIHRDEPVLLGFFAFSQPEPHVDLFILRARATMLPPSAAIPPDK
jgi:hypothetical protein